MSAHSHATRVHTFRLCPQLTSSVWSPVIPLKQNAARMLPARSLSRGGHLGSKCHRDTSKRHHKAPRHHPVHSQGCHRFLWTCCPLCDPASIPQSTGQTQGRMLGSFPEMLPARTKLSPQTPLCSQAVSAGKKPMYRSTLGTPSSPLFYCTFRALRDTPDSVHA